MPVGQLVLDTNYKHLKILRKERGGVRKRGTEKEGRERERESERESYPVNRTRSPQDDQTPP